MTLDIIGISGYKRTGKDTVAGFLTKHYEYQRLGLADAVKEMALAIDPIVFETWDKDGGPAGGTLLYRLSDVVEEIGWEEAKEWPEVRRLLQRIGTEGVRSIISHDAWLKVAERKILEEEGRWVIPDVRFPNEANWVKGLGGRVWKIERPGTAPDGHASENGVDYIVPDLTLKNDGDLIDLEAAVVTVQLEVGMAP